MINIIVISDIKIYCEGLHHIFEDACSINVIGAVSNFETARALVASALPEVVLLDMTMASSCQLAREIADISDATRIVALAVPQDERNIVQCAEAGITGYVLREASTDDLIEAVVQAARGECYCPPKIAACFLRKLADIAACAKKADLQQERLLPALATLPQDLETRLTRREKEIARLLFDGLTNKQIARNLNLEVSTVKNHVHNVLTKLDVKTRSQAISRLQKFVHKASRLPESFDLVPSRSSIPDSGF